VMATDATEPAAAPMSTATPSTPPAAVTSAPKAASAPRNEPPPPTFDSEDIDNIPF
jgi:hypothetical protein